MMTGNSGWRSLIWGSSSRPLWPGRARSRSTRSKFSSSRIRNPSSPAAAILTEYPSSMSSTSSDSRMEASSSMTRMLAPVKLPVAADAETGRFKGSSTSGMNGIPQQGKLEMKGCAGADGALDMDLAGVFLDDAVGDGEAEAGAAPVARLGHCFGGEERIVDALEILGSDAGAGVGDQRLDVPVGQRGHAQTAAAGHGFLGVQQEVEKDLLQLAGVAVNGGELLGQVEIDDDLRGLELVFEQGKRVSNDLI